MSTIQMIAIVREGINCNRCELSEPEFVGDGLMSIEDAREAAMDALYYIGERAEWVEIYEDGELVETVRR